MVGNCTLVSGSRTLVSVQKHVKKGTFIRRAGALLKIMKIMTSHIRGRAVVGIGDGKSSHSGIRVDGTELAASDQSVANSVIAAASVLLQHSGHMCVDVGRALADVVIHEILLLFVDQTLELRDGTVRIGHPEFEVQDVRHRAAGLPYVDRLILDDEIRMRYCGLNAAGVRDRWS